MDTLEYCLIPMNDEPWLYEHPFSKVIPNIGLFHEMDAIIFGYVPDFTLRFQCNQ